MVQRPLSSDEVAGEALPYGLRQSLAESIGHTPLLELDGLTADEAMTA